MKRKRNAPKTYTPTAAEEAHGRKQVKIRGKLHHRDVSEKMGADGVIETHVNYSHIEKKHFGRAKDKYCADCRTWIIQNYERREHGGKCNG